MSLSNQDANKLRVGLNRNTTLSIKSKTILNTFINNKKTAFDRSTFMQQYNAKMRNLRSNEPNIGKRKRSPDNLNSAMENNTGTVSGGSVNPAKNGRRSPRGPLSGISGASNTSNNRNNVSSSPNKKKARFETAAVGAQRAIAAANNARRKAVANVKRKAIIDRQQGNANVKRKAAANKVNANARENAELLMNVSRKAAAEKANANAKAMANRAATNKAVANKVNANARTKVAANKVNANVRAKVVANKANANVRATPMLTNWTTLQDVVDLILSKNQFIEIAKNLKISYKSKDSVEILKTLIMNYENKDELKVEINKQVVGGKESNEITDKVNSYISNIPNTNVGRPNYTASLVILYIKDLPASARKKIIKGDATLNQFMNGINRRTIKSNKINFEKNITKEQFTELVFIIWLDGVHDEYITESLDVWFNNTTLFTDKQKKFVVKAWKTDFIDIIKSLNLPKKRINILNSSLGDYAKGWEKKLKDYLTTKYTSKIIKISTIFGKQLKTSTPQNINIAIDQEYKDNNENSISRFIRDHKKNNNSNTDVNTLITYGQAFDPGRSMVSGGVHQNIEKLTLNTIPKNLISAKKKYYLCNLNINLKVNNTSVFKLQVNKDQRNNVGVSFNDKKILTGISGGKADKSTGDIIAISKYFGDALQYYSLAIMDDVKRTEKTERFFFGSGDSMALLGYDRVCEIFNKDIRMVIDFPTAYSPTIYVVGMNMIVKNQPQPSASMMTGTVPSNNKRGNEVTSSIKKRKS